MVNITVITLSISLYDLQINIYTARQHKFQYTTGKNMNLMHGDVRLYGIKFTTTIEKNNSLHWSKVSKKYFEPCKRQ